MTQIGEILGFFLQGEERERGASRRTTLVEFLKEKMNGLDQVERRRRRRKKSFKERLGLKGLGWCGSTWGGFRPSTTTTVQDDEAMQLGPQVDQPEVTEVGQTRPANFANLNCGGEIPATPSMNLATALAAERHYRAAQDTESGGSPLGPMTNRPSSVTGGTAPGTPLRVSLMRLLEEEATDGRDGERETVEEKEERGGGGGGGVVAGSDSVCCVCMGRKKGAAFVPCGHTFCRVCSRELWLNRGSCPLCNTPILQILDIF